MELNKKPIKIAIYGKGGIGKSTVASNLAIAFSEQGLTVMQIGCDPKADSTANLHNGTSIPTVLELIREKGAALSLDELVTEGDNGVLCVEAGGPSPGTGCAGRGIIAALEKLKDLGAYERYRPDIILYDVLGDVVCGGFSMPMRTGYADRVFIVTSGENMALHAAANIAMAIDHFKERDYASLGGLILNRRNVPKEDEKVNELAKDFHTSVLGSIQFSPLVQQAEEKKQTLLTAFPDCEIAEEYRTLATRVRNGCLEK